MNTKKLNALGSGSTLNKNKKSCNVSINGEYTLVYFCGPEFYLKPLKSNKKDILFTNEQDEQGMFGGLKIGSCILIKTDGKCPTIEDCHNAFLSRYKSTEDAMSTAYIGGFVINGYIKNLNIDKEVRAIFECVGNYNHPEKKVQRSDNMECGTISGSSFVFSNGVKTEITTTVRKIGKENMYNNTGEDIEDTSSICYNICNNLDNSINKDIMNDEDVALACKCFYDKLVQNNLIEINTTPTVFDNKIIKNSIIKDIKKDKERCFVKTPECVIKTMTDEIFKSKTNNKQLSIAVIAKTYDDVINISENIQRFSNLNCKFTLICSYDNSDLPTNVSNTNIIYINDNTFDNINNMKFDYIIQNPPYDGTLHLDYFEWCYNLQKKNKGKMIIIQPDSIFVDVRQATSSKTNAYRVRQIKKMLDIDKSVYKIIIENYNYDFETNAYYPHSITFVDFSKKHNSVDFCCYGYHKTITSIQNESNPFGDLKVIESIMDKIDNAFPDKMSNHIAKNKGIYPKGTHFLKYADIIGASGGGFAGSYGKTLQKAPALSDAGKFTSIYGDFVTGYLAPNCHPTNNKIEKSMIYSNNVNDGKEGNKKIDNVYGSKEELKNWIENSTNNIIPLFINIIYTWDQNNHTKQIMPWMVDKVYSMEDVFEKCGFTNDECQFIMKVILMYRRDGAYFRRFLLGINEELIIKLKDISANSNNKGIPENIKSTLKVESDDDISNYIKQCEKEAQEYVEGRC